MSETPNTMSEDSEDPMSTGNEPKDWIVVCNEGEPSTLYPKTTALDATKKAVADWGLETDPGYLFYAFSPDDLAAGIQTFEHYLDVRPAGVS